MSPQNSCNVNQKKNSIWNNIIYIIWNILQLALRTNGLEIANWETIISEAFYSLQLLLCTATNEVPLDRFFNFPVVLCLIQILQYG